MLAHLSSPTSPPSISIITAWMSNGYQLNFGSRDFSAQAIPPRRVCWAKLGGMKKKRSKFGVHVFVNKQDFRGLGRFLFCPVLPNKIVWATETPGSWAMGGILGKMKNRKRAKRVVRRTRVRRLLKQDSTEKNLWSNPPGQTLGRTGQNWADTGQTLALAHTWPGYGLGLWGRGRQGGCRV